jgi:hypothetical protein
MHDYRKYAARAIVALATANLILPLPLLFRCLDSRSAQGGGAKNALPTHVCKHAQRMRAGADRASVAGRPDGKDFGVPRQRSKVDLKCRLFLGRATEPRLKDGCERFSPFADRPTANCAADLLFAPQTSRHVDCAGSAQDRCVDLSRLMV